MNTVTQTMGPADSKVYPNFGGTAEIIDFGIGKGNLRDAMPLPLIETSITVEGYGGIFCLAVIPSDVLHVGPGI